MTTDTESSNGNEANGEEVDLHDEIDELALEIERAIREWDEKLEEYRE